MSLVSTKIPFKGAGKEYIGELPSFFFSFSTCGMMESGPLVAKLLTYLPAPPLAGCS